MRFLQTWFPSEILSWLFQSQSDEGFQLHYQSLLWMMNTFLMLRQYEQSSFLHYQSSSFRSSYIDFIYFYGSITQIGHFWLPFCYLINLILLSMRALESKDSREQLRWSYLNREEIVCFVFILLLMYFFIQQSHITQKPSSFIYISNGEILLIYYSFNQSKLTILMAVIITHGSVD